MQNRLFGSAVIGLLAALGSTVAHSQPIQTVEAGTQTIVKVPSSLTLELGTDFDLPFGDSARWFSYGAATDLDFHYGIPGSPFYPMGGIEYTYTTTKIAASMSLAAARLGGGMQLPLTNAISILGFAAAGYYFGAYNDLSATALDPYAAGGLGLKFSLGPSFSLDLGAQYKSFFGLYQGLSAGLGIGIALGDIGGSVGISRVDLRPAFPMFYKYYDDHPIGSLELKSDLKVPATNIRARVFIKEFMDAPKVMEVPDALAPGASESLDLYALFVDKMLNITEGTKVAAEISVTYTVNGKVYEDKKIETLSVMGRNAITWDDNRKAAVYVSAKDPGVLNFARSVTSFVQGQENRSICGNLQAAIALHEALDIYGLNYSTTQRTPYSEISKQKDVVDFVQFPTETFQYHAGDCSDIAILYCALFQAAGIDAAFITIPGHIFVAFDSGLTPEKAPQELIPPGRYIAYEGKAWIPVEVTAIHGGFLNAWDIGAKEWNENTFQGLAGFYPIQEAWAVYPSVGLPVESAKVAVPDSSKVLAAYQNEIQKHIDSAIGPQVALLKNQIKLNGNLAAMNNLGVLFAKYGQLEKAKQEFTEVVASRPVLSSLLNLGHLYYTMKDWKNASLFYRRANRLNPDIPKVLLALARVNLELQQYDEAKDDYKRLKALDPVLAGQFAYLGDSTESGIRAANMEDERGAIQWETEE
jgi:tetratricopeptide (TPR) repeat protein